MNEDFGKIKNRHIYNYICVFFICIIVLCLYLIQIFQNNIDKSKYVIMNNNWNIEINGNNDKNVTLDKYTFENISKGSKIVMTTRLPEMNMDYPVIQIKTYYCNIKCIIDGKEIFYQNQSGNPGKKISNIEILNEYSGKNFRVELEAVADNAFSKIKSPQIINEINYSNSFVSEHLLECALCFFIFTMGIIIIIKVFIQGEYNQKQRKLLWIGIFCASISLWMLSFFDIQYILIDNDRIISVFEFVNILIAVQALLLYFYDSLIEIYCKRIFMILFEIGLFILIVSLLFIKYSGYYLINFQIWFNIYIIVAIGIVIYMIQYKSDKKYRSNQLELFSAVLYVFTGFVGILRKVFISNNINSRLISIILVILVLFLVFSLITSYVIYLKEVFNETAERTVLTKMAYQDMLTGVANRVKCKEYMDNLIIEKNKNVSVVYFDLNYLKVINDTMGHMRGDNYICEFARLLQHAFGESGIVGRIGGDEFIAINNIENEVKIKEKISSMVEMASQGDNPNIGMKISFAYGYALSDIEECYSVFELEKIADKRMYECKASQKAGRK